MEVDYLSECWEGGMSSRRGTDRPWLMRVIAAAVITIWAQGAYADVTEPTAADYLRLEKTKAAIMVLQLKTEFLPGTPEYTIGHQKYIAAQQAFNNYTKAAIGNYVLGTKTDLSASAQLAYSKAADFQAYISSLQFKHKGFSAVFALVPVLIDIGDKLYTLYATKQKGEREARAKELSLEVTWDDWEKI